MTKELFSVVQFFPNGTYEYVRTNVVYTEAVAAFNHYTNSVGAKMGITAKVIITDQDDLTCAVWQFGRGIVFPPLPVQP